MLFRNNLLRFNRFMGGGGSRSQLRNQSPRQYGPSYPPPTEQDPPAAHITTKQTTVSVGTEVSFDGSKSTGSGLKYSWNLGDGANPATATTPQTSCTYSSTGEKTVSLIVTDDRGVESEAATLNITVIELTLNGPATVTRGGTATYTATVEPAGLNLTYDWKFTGKGSEIPGPSVSSTSGPKKPSTWKGPMVVTGTIEVTAKVDNKPFKKSLETTVESRGWRDTFPEPSIMPDGRQGTLLIPDARQGTLPVLPEDDYHLGRTVRPGEDAFTGAAVDVLAGIVPPNGGPNAGWMLLMKPPLGSEAWEMEAQINYAALEDPTNQFYKNNQNKAPNYMVKLKERVRIHEGVIEDPDGVYTSHAAEGLKKIKQIPLNPWAEEQVQYFNLINDPNWERARQAFETDRRTKFIARAVKVLTKFAEHPPNKYPNLPTPTYDYD